MLQPQLTEQVQLLINKDEREKSIGQKRNELVEWSTGEYVVFIDDDDRIHQNYVQHVLDALSYYPGVDCVGIKGQYFENGRYRRNFMHSIECNEYTQDRYFYYRPPNHINPIRREIAIDYKFPEINMGEDTDFAMRMSRDGALRSEVFVDHFLYEYHYVSRKAY